MAQNMIAPSVRPNYTDKRKLSLPAGTGPDTRIVGITIFTCNATGSTTTAVGANAAPGTNDVNVVRRGEKFKLFTAAGVQKEETVFRITGVAVAASTTVTFTPAAATAPVSTDVLKRTSIDYSDDLADLDFRLNQISSTTYTQAVLDNMTLNDKIMAIRAFDDPGSI